LLLKYPATPPKIRPTTDNAIAAAAPLITTAPMMKHVKNTPEPTRKPIVIGMNFEPAKARASPTTIAIIPMNFYSPKRIEKSKPHPAI